ncbi:MAG: hypothetical protein AAF467_06405 [Actinomycetota bacterium]
MEIEVDTRSDELGPHQHADAEGFVMPLPAGTGPRRIPRGDFPTGPPVGAHLPDVRAVDHHGRMVDLHVDRAGRPAVLVFSRSAVW